MKEIKKKQRKKYYIVNWECEHPKLFGVLKKKYKYINIYKYYYIGRVIDDNLCRQITHNIHKRGYIY